MSIRSIVLVAVLAVVAAAGIWVAWMLRYRPLAVFAWQTRVAAAQRRVAQGDGRYAGRPADACSSAAGGPRLCSCTAQGTTPERGSRSRASCCEAPHPHPPRPRRARWQRSAVRAHHVRQVIEGVEGVLAGLAPKKVALVGNSLGAWLRLVVANRQPQGVALCVCIDGGAIKGSNERARSCRGRAPRRGRRSPRPRDPASAPFPASCSTTSCARQRWGPSPASPPPPRRWRHSCWTTRSSAS